MLRLILFYLPMGASALLASLTHVIISGVLARSPHPDLTISGYAIALSLSFILEQAIAPLRQTSAKYVKDQHSFREMVRMIVTIVGIIALFNALIAWTPLGALVPLCFRGSRRLVGCHSQCLSNLDVRERVFRCPQLVPRHYYPASVDQMDDYRHSDTLIRHGPYVLGNGLLESN